MDNYFSKIRSDRIRSVTQSCLTLCNPMNCSTPGLPVHHQLPEFTQTHVHRVSDAIQRSHRVVPFSSCPQSLPASESFPMSQLFTWPKYWSFSFSIIPCKEIPGLISFKMDWLDLLAVQGTLKSLLQHHSSKASILHRSALIKAVNYTTKIPVNYHQSWQQVPNKAECVGSKLRWHVPSNMRRCCRGREDSCIYFPAHGVHAL